MAVTKGRDGLNRVRPQVKGPIRNLLPNPAVEFGSTLVGYRPGQPEDGRALAIHVQEVNSHLLEEILLELREMNKRLAAGSPDEGPGE